MKKLQYDEIISYLKGWVKKEGLCRFCNRGRMCSWSRRGRQECPSYRFANEMDCFHLWIAFFDRKPIFREGYDTPNSYPWMNESPERDVPPGSTLPVPSDREMEKRVRIKELKRRKYDLMQELDDRSRELEKIENLIIEKALKTT